MSLYFALLTVENNKKKKSVKFQGDMFSFCDFIQVYVFTTNYHLNDKIDCSVPVGRINSSNRTLMVCRGKHI